MQTQLFPGILIHKIPSSVHDRLLQKYERSALCDEAGGEVTKFLIHCVMTVMCLVVLSSLSI